MEKIIIYGMGDEFARNKEQILMRFGVVGCTDSYKKPSNEWEREYFIAPEKLAGATFDRILVCSSRYRDAIRIRLFRAGIDAEKVIFLDSLKRENNEPLSAVIEDMEKYIEKNADRRFAVKEDSMMVITDEKDCEAGNPGIHYFAQDIWGAHKIYKRKPAKHYDIGSSLNGFIAHLLVFREVYYIDVRPLNRNIPGLHYLYGDAMDLENIESGSIESLSSLSAIEHFGLGRYGDVVDPEGYIKGAENMQRILCQGGHLYLSVPVGPEDKLVFNAHRIFKMETVIRLFDECQLKDVAIVEPDGVWPREISKEYYGNIKDFSCGLFEFVKM